jgi:hypothetical protein
MSVATLRYPYLLSGISQPIRAQSLAARGGFLWSAFYVLDTSFLSLSPPGSDSAEVPAGNWANSDVKTSASQGTQYVSFFSLGKIGGNTGYMRSMVASRNSTWYPARATV